LAAKLEVHRLTVNRVMRELTQSGHVKRRRGIVTIVASAQGNEPVTTTQRTPFGAGLVGLVSGHSFNPVTNPYYNEIFEGLRKGLQTNDFFLMPLGDMGEFLELLAGTSGPEIEASLAAVAVLGPVEPKTHALLEAMDLPVAIVGASEYPGPLPSIASDDSKDAALLTEKILAAGRQHIVHINAAGPSRLQSRLEGFLSACDAAGRTVPFHYVVEANGLEVQDGREAMHRFIERHLPFNAVFGGNDNLAIGASIALKEAGVLIPEDVSVVGFDGIPFSTSILSNLATMSVPRFKIGQIAAKIITDLCVRKSTDQMLVRLDSSWIPGETLVDLNSTASALSRAPVLGKSSNLTQDGQPPLDIIT
jgi:LacI family transcriptional regulator